MKPRKSERNIAAEMIDLARERGEGLTRDELIRIGYTPEQIDANKDDVSAALLQMQHQAAA